VEDKEVLEAFVGGGVVHAFGQKLHVEGDTLAFDGWWKAAFRVTRSTFAVREEPLPEPSTCMDDLAECLREHGMRVVGADPSLLVAITYTVLDLGVSDWTVWSTNQLSAEADLAARAGIDTFFNDAPAVGPATTPRVHEAQRGGARRTAGLAPLVIVAVGIDKKAVDAMAAELGTCRIEARGVDEIDPDGCCALLPDLTFVDATTAAGMMFVLGLRATAQGEAMPLVAIAPNGTWTPADVNVSPEGSPQEWAAHIRDLLP
jgi:hypothetical protein